MKVMKTIILTVWAFLTVAGNESQAQPDADFTFNFPSDSCGSSVTVDFTNQSSGANNYKWYFGEAGSNPSTVENPSYTYQNRGEYLVVLEAMTSNDTSLASKVIDIDDPVDTFISPYPSSPVCTGDSVTFYGPTNLKKWIFDDGSTSTKDNPVRVYGNPGSYNVQMIAANNCNVDTGSVTVQVSNNAKPSINSVYADQSTACPGRRINFSSSSNLELLDQVKWEFGDGATSTESYPTHTYSDTGTYTVSLMGANGCNWDTASTQVTIDLQSKLNTGSFFMYTPDALCVGDTGSFRIQPFDEVQSYKWDFGDGAQSTLEDAKHAYSQADTFSVELTAYGYCGDSIKKTEDVIVSSSARYGPLGQAFNWDPGNVCPGTETQFRAYDFQGFESASFSWDFGDGSTGSGPYPTNVYTDTGNYQVTLTITSPCGGQRTFSRNVPVKNDNDISPVGFDVLPNAPQCTGATFRFSYDDTNEFRNVKWFFGDGNTSTQKGSVTHAYTDTGEYKVLLRAYNHCGDRGYDYRQVQVSEDAKPEPYIGIRALDHCPGEQIGFETSSAYDSYIWKFGDGDTSHSMEPHHAYDSGGTYQVKLVVEGQCGIDTVSRELALNSGSKPDFDFNVACLGDPTHFTDKSSPTPSSWSWDFGNGQISSDQNPAIKYDSVGTYAVTLAVKENGCRRSITKEVEVANQPPTATFTDSANGLTVHLTETSSFVDSFYWTFGDNTNSNAANPVKQYDSAGTYEVCLMVFNDCGDDSTCQTIAVERTSISDPSDNNDLVLYPNPAEDELQLQLKGSDKPITNLQIINAKGQVMETNADLRKRAQGSNTLNIEQLKTGVYFLKIMTRDGEQYTRKFVVK